MMFISLAILHLDKKRKKDKLKPTESVDNLGSSSHLLSPCKNTVHPQS